MTRRGGIYRFSWCKENIFGSSRFEFSQSTRGIWNDLLDLAKISRVAGGVIAPADDMTYTHEWLAGLLNTPLVEFEAALKVLIETDRIIENGAGIKIVKWNQYQTEYDRQKPYRQAAKKAQGRPAEDPEKYVKGKYGHMVKR